MRHGSRAAAALIAAWAGFFAATGGAAANGGNANITATVTQLRSAKGQVLACLTTQPHAFPDCSHDPHSRKLKVPVSAHVLELDFGPVPEGRYAISLVHDENGNGKLDTALMMPREGFGFSRDAPVRMGPPKFESAAFAVTAADEHLSIRMRYML